MELQRGECEHVGNYIEYLHESWTNLYGMPLLVLLDSVVCGNECVMPKTSTLMMLILILAAQMEITVTIVTLSQVRLAGLEVLMGAG